MHQLLYGSEELGAHDLDRFVVVFIDNIFFISKRDSDHEEYLILVLQEATR
jgi:hypothetical protein